ncbi:MAG: alpha/beta hydrolase, partial [bacterium]|nr:alpha/beta hydrolase [bacterium]
LGFAARHPQRVSRLVIMDTAPYPEWSLLTRLLIGLLGQPRLSRLLLTRRLFRGLLQLAVAHPRVITASVAELYRQPWIADDAGRRAFSQTVAMPPERLTLPREHLKRITMPALVLWAQKDRLFSQRVARQLAGDLADATLTVVPDCGHFLQEEQPELIVDHLQSFLKAAG